MAVNGQIKKVCLIGANGLVGSVILDYLIQAATFDVSILRRTNSTSSTKAAHESLVTEIPISPELGLEELTHAFKGQDAVVLSVPLKDINMHMRIAEAACTAGVRRFIPAEFGSDSTHPLAIEHLQLFRDKTKVRQWCDELVEKSTLSGGCFSWTAVACGLLFDDGLREGYWFFDLNKRTARIMDGGTIRASTCTIPRAAQAVVAILQKPEATPNSLAFVQSFCPTQLEVLDALEKVTGCTWTREPFESTTFLEQERQKLATGELSLGAHVGSAGPVVSILVGQNWAAKKDFAMGPLGLEDEVLDEVVAGVVASHEKAKTTK
ncbi:NmrA family transcriptional regulator [Ophiocordyceps camponoti-floridani]|uniref:NmrA family transcriptional regulator n=1 Tax=Ophiocordyceps camponoti-floridani TaxID=2030778 RepID=A0A8H4Q361_9HYPO|nr:NmrA family transcriptional regulator [Ophiocordyceps camponoti-floridani]